MERMRYFTGGFMTARDFRDEQEYFLSRTRLHNRMMHGWGIVCGLFVVPHPDKNCWDDAVVVKCGLAIDCCGREVVVPKDLVSRKISESFPRGNDGKPKPPER